MLMIVDCSHDANDHDHDAYDHVHEHDTNDCVHDYEFRSTCHEMQKKSNCALKDGSGRKCNKILNSCDRCA